MIRLRTGFLGVLAAVIPTLGLTMTGFAAKEPRYTVTIPNAAVGKTYTAYRIFDTEMSRTNDETTAGRTNYTKKHATPSNKATSGDWDETADNEYTEDVSTPADASAKPDTDDITLAGNDILPLNTGPAEFTLEKTGDGDTLYGAVFNLYRTLDDAESDKNVLRFTVNEDDSVYTLYDEAAGYEGGQISADISAGISLVTGLDYGMYYIVETQPPQGYSKLIFPVAVSISEYEIYYWQINEPGRVEEAFRGKVYIENHTDSGTYMLPATGGMGTKAFSTAGLILIGTGILTLLWKKLRN